MNRQVAILIPAHDEGGYIAACLDALLQSDAVPGRVGVAVIANACTDDTAAVARGFKAALDARGWDLNVIETATPGKLNALNLGEAATKADIRIYLDADVIVSPALVGELVRALQGSAPAYAGGTPEVVATGSPLLAAYARFWVTLPFVATGVPGFGIFAVNAAGRARWGAYPDIISDDTFVRLHFAPGERTRVPATYRWPMVAGLGNLIRVRRRQDAGVAEIARDHPHLIANDDKVRVGARGLLRRLLRDPAGFCAYALVSLAVRLPVARSKYRWVRGR